MRHDIHTRGIAFQLRPVTLDDAEFIVALRTSERGKLLHPTSPSIADQRAWTESYFQREGDWYFIIADVKEGSSHGAVAIYNYDANANTAEWGRWIIKHGSLAGIESAALVYDTGFERLGLKLMYTRTEEANLPVISFHTSIGSTTNGPVVGPQGERWIEQQMTASSWLELRSTLESKIEAAAALASR